MKYLKVEKLFSVRIFTVGRVCQTLIGKFDRLSKIASRLRSRLTIMIWKTFLCKINIKFFDKKFAKSVRPTLLISCGDLLFLKICWFMKIGLRK